MPTDPVRISLGMSTRSMRKPVNTSNGKQMIAVLHMRMTMESDGPEARTSERTNTYEMPQVKIAKASASKAVVLEVIVPIEAKKVIWSIVVRAGEI